MNPAEEQLIDGMDARVAHTLAILGWHDLADEVRRRLPDVAHRYFLHLSSENPADVAEASVDLAGVAWDVDPEPDWWGTPVGRLVARSITPDAEDAVTQQVAADILGVTRGTVAQLVHRGTLQRHPDGGVLFGSVLERLLRTGETPR